MRMSALNAYRCPRTGGELVFSPDGSCELLKSGHLRSEGNFSYRVSDGVVDFTSEGVLSSRDAVAREAYDAQAGQAYENAMAWLWQAFDQDEIRVRSMMMDALDIVPGQRILEIGCGSGSDSQMMLKRLKSGELFLQDISSGMIDVCRRRLAPFEADVSLEYSVSATASLPFADGYFDRVFHFGGLNMFDDIRRSLSEMARVTKLGGRVVVGDESVAPWLRGSEFGRLVINNNPLYAATAPIDQLPESAEDVSLQYIVANTFYLLSFSVGKGAPVADYDLPHKGRRGGTMRTRYYGQLEGVTLEAKELAIKAAEKSGVSLHDWLDDAVRIKALATAKS